ncbi:hypothetical protein VP381E491_P0016 [Vibrio phage 381E49-1]|nr:hypothetical protein VP381E491_P0016 [Vibrio phage 381E49-1]
MWSGVYVNHGHNRFACESLIDNLLPCYNKKAPRLAGQSGLNILSTKGL